MSVVINFKDPDATFKLSDEAVPGDGDDPQVSEARTAFLKKHFEHCEYGCIELSIVDGKPHARLMERTRGGKWK